MPASSISKRQTHKRSRNGCFTCRDRHIKCDEASPKCMNCVKTGRSCERGMRLNFLKCAVGTISSKSYKGKSITPVLRTTNYDRINFMDQSLSIHKIYKENPFHSYKSWFVGHSIEELAMSDMDIESAAVATVITTTPTVEKHNNTTTIITGVEPSKDFPKIQESFAQVSMTPFNDNYLNEFMYTVTDSSIAASSLNLSDCSTYSPISSTFSISPDPSYYSPASEQATIIQSTKEEFELTTFLFKLLSNSPPNLIGSVFGTQHASSILNYLQVLKMTLPYNLPAYQQSLQITLSDINDFIDYIEDLITLENWKSLQSYFPIFLNSLNIFFKTNDELSEVIFSSYVSIRISDVFAKLLSNESFQTYDILMNILEIYILDMNRSFTFCSIRVFDLNKIDYERIFNKIMEINMGNLLHHSIIGCFTILLRLNNILYNLTISPNNDKSSLELMSILSDLKTLEKNNSLAYYFPQIKPSMSPSITAPIITHQTYQSEILHTLFLFILQFIETNIYLSADMLIKFREHSLLSTFWESVYHCDSHKERFLIVSKSTTAVHMDTFMQNGLQFLTVETSLAK